MDWDDTKVLSAEPGEFLTIARKAKGTQKWFVGAITNEGARNQTMTLSFLPSSANYVATIYKDATNADWKDNPMSYVIEKFIVNNSSSLSLALAPGGGAAISLLPASANDLKTIKKYK